MPDTSTPTIALDLKRGDIFDRHGHTWTVVDTWRGEYGCVVALTDRGTVYLPAKAEVGVRRDA